MNTRLELALRASKVGVWEWNIVTNELIWNQQMYNIYGVKEENFEGAYQAWEKGLHESDKERSVAEVQEAILNRKKFDTQFRVVHPTGEIRIVKALADLICDENGEPQSMIGVNWDITESKKMADKLAVSSKLAALGELSGGIAHEINNPMTTLIGNLHLAETLLEFQEIDIERITSLISKCNETAERIVNIVKGLRQVARDGFSEDKDRVKFADVFAPVKDVFLGRLQKHNISFDVDEDIFNKEIECYPTQFSQVVFNLIGNALDACVEKEDRWIKLDLEKTPSLVKMTISNSGLAIPEDALEKMFDPFYTTKEVGSGTGLGLSISKGIVERHNGTIYLDEEAPYVKFVVEIPQTAHVSKEAA